ncbi:MAG: hypothetical protein KME46_33055 [Brasilonema angustatum HA4187-MV1]|nr:hypothetical protein [Brasilonema angustatum HA4187-MV1]
MATRKINPKSLENLKMGSVARNQGKVRCNITILPETKAWLSKGGNLSSRIDELVGKYLKGDLVGIRALREMEERCQELEARLSSLNGEDIAIKKVRQ